MKTYLNKKLPRMAWFVELAHSSAPIYLEHGISVIVAEEFTFEGTFNGEITKNGISSSNVG